MAENDAARPARSWRQGLRIAAVSLGSGFIALAVFNLLGETVLLHSVTYFSRNKALLALLAPEKLDNMNRYAPHPYFLFLPRPSYRSADGRLRHNSFGCRAPEAAVPKPAGVYRIVIVGGSTTYELTVSDNDKTFAYRLERRLNERPRRPGLKRVEVINCGAPGSTSAENLSRYVFSLSQYQPDLLIVQQGLNDSWPRTMPKMSRDYREYSKAWVEDLETGAGSSFIERLLRAAYDRARGRDSVLTQGVLFLVRRPYWDMTFGGGDLSNMAHNTPWVFEANTRALIRLAKADGVKVLLQTEHIALWPVPVADRRLDWRTLRWGTPRATLEHNDVLKRLASQERTLFFDLQGQLCACYLIMPDGKHLNEAGNAQKADAMFDYLRRRL